MYWNRNSFKVCSFLNLASLEFYISYTTQLSRCELNDLLKKWFEELIFIENKMFRNYFFAFFIRERSVDLILKMVFQINLVRYAYFQVSESGSRYIMHTNISHHPLDMIYYNIFITTCKLHLTYGIIYILTKSRHFK